MTLLTDYLLGVLCVVLALRMRRRGLPRNRSKWVQALLACAIAAFAGGSCHGFLPWLDGRLATVLWRLTLLAIGWAAYAAVVATALAHLVARQRAVLRLARIQVAIYALVTIARGEFIVAIVNYSLAFAVVLGVHCRAWWQHGDRAALTVVAGVLVTFLAAAIQAAKLAPHPAFNHNDLYHLVQMAGTVLLYRGALGSARDLAQPPTTRSNHAHLAR